MTNRNFVRWMDNVEKLLDDAEIEISKHYIWYWGFIKGISPERAVDIAVEDKYGIHS